jgi:hypothetical protein
VGGSRCRHQECQAEGDREDAYVRSSHEEFLSIGL